MLGNNHFIVRLFRRRGEFNGLYWKRMITGWDSWYFSMVIDDFRALNVHRYQFHFDWNCFSRLVYVVPQQTSWNICKTIHKLTLFMRTLFTQYQHICIHIPDERNHPNQPTPPPYSNAFISTRHTRLFLYLLLLFVVVGSNLHPQNNHCRSSHDVQFGTSWFWLGP